MKQLLKDALDSSVTGDIIVLEDNITISSKTNAPGVTGKEITIDGKNFTITGWRDEEGSLSAESKLLLQQELME